MRNPLLNILNHDKIRFLKKLTSHKATTAVKKEISLPPIPQAPDFCCMSGCQKCNWDIYFDEIKAYEEKHKVDIKHLVKEMDESLKAFLELEKR